MLKQIDFFTPADFVINFKNELYKYMYTYIVIFYLISIQKY